MHTWFAYYKEKITHIGPDSLLALNYKCIPWFLWNVRDVRQDSNNSLPTNLKEIIYEQYNITIKVKGIHYDDESSLKEERGTMRSKISSHNKDGKKYYYQLIISLKRVLNDLTYSKGRLLDT